MKPAPFVWTGDWAIVPGTLNKHHVAAIYGLHPDNVKKKAAAAARDLPTPFLLQPYRWRKADVKRHYETTSITDQRRALRRVS